ncbi:MAG: hypothetical protein WC602_05450 [archaeon]
MEKYFPAFEDKWREYFEKLDDETMERVTKKIKKILEFPRKRHMKMGEKFFVDRASQNRIVYDVFEEMNEVKFYFVGNHKEYEKWYTQFF